MREATIGREEEKKPAMQRAAKNMAKLTERPLARKPAQSPIIDKRIMLRLPTLSLNDAHTMVPDMGQIDTGNQLMCEGWGCTHARGEACD